MLIIISMNVERCSITVFHNNYNTIVLCKNKQMYYPRSKCLFIFSLDRGL